MQQSAKVKIDNVALATVSFNSGVFRINSFPADNLKIDVTNYLYTISASDIAFSVDVEGHVKVDLIDAKLSLHLKAGGSVNLAFQF